MPENDNRGEVWVRKKPRRIIHNQLLIQLLIIFAIASPIPLSGVAFYCVFYVVPSVIIPVGLCLWVALVVVYGILYAYFKVKGP